MEVSRVDISKGTMGPRRKDRTGGVVGGDYNGLVRKGWQSCWFFTRTREATSHFKTELHARAFPLSPASDACGGGRTGGQHVWRSKQGQKIWTWGANEILVGLKFFDRVGHKKVGEFIINVVANVSNKCRG